MQEIVNIIKQGNYDCVTILGPTASGKTRYAVNLAQQLCNEYKNTEILSADSRQVYKGMDIGTGKDLNEYGNIPYHLIDIVPAGTKYNIFEYQRDFSKAYKDIIDRNCFPLICGGSGLYIEAATRGYQLVEVKPNNSLRQELEQKSMEELIKILTDLKAAKGEKPHNNTDFDTKKRAIRAIEIEMAQDALKENDLQLVLPQKTLFIGISVSRDIRNKRIDARLQARLQEGMVDEVKNLLNSGINPDNLIYYGLEYKFITNYLIGQIDYNQMVEGLRTAIHQFAKRQMTWFRGMERKGINIMWIEQNI